MTKDQREENARLRNAGRIPAETLSYLANVDAKRRKKTASLIGPVGSLIAVVMVLSSNHVLPVPTAKVLVGIGIVFILFSLYSLCRDALIGGNNNRKQRAIPTP
jgi:hypothetical protein